MLQRPGLSLKFHCTVVRFFVSATSSSFDRIKLSSKYSLSASVQTGTFEDSSVFVCPLLIIKSPQTKVSVNRGVAFITINLSHHQSLPVLSTRVFIGLVLPVGVDINSPANSLHNEKPKALMDLSGILQFLFLLFQGRLVSYQNQCHVLILEVCLGHFTHLLWRDGINVFDTIGEKRIVQLV